MTASFETSIITTEGCPACKANQWAPGLDQLTDYLTDENFEIRRCEQCRLQVTHPLPATDQIYRYYPSRYRGNRHAFTGSWRSWLRGRAIKAQFPPRFTGRLLDIGCGDGSFALHMKSLGWQVAATEIDPETVQRLGRMGVDAKLSSDAQSDGFDAPFDAITCWHVLEHVQYPRQVVDWAMSHLVTGGVFQATVPNAGSLQARLAGRHWVHLDVPRHRQHFTADTFQTLFDEAGFKVGHRSNFALEYDWFGVIQSALNGICGKPNVLFDQLTAAAPDPANPISKRDKLISWMTLPPIAMLSLPVIFTAAAVGEGATLTLTGKVNRR